MESNTITYHDKLIKNYNEELSHSGVDGKRIARRLSELSKIGAIENNGVTRVGYSQEEKEAKELVIGWMKEAGLEVSTDGAGNVCGRLDGESDGNTVMSGSHLDSVPNGGNFDGPLGVLSALEVVEAWNETGYIPPIPYEVAIFSDEEGSRFKSGLTGSRSFMGSITNEELDVLVDENGCSFDEVIESYGSNREKYLRASSKEKNIEAFVEVHIEQGTILEQNNQTVGIVNGIAGPAWLEVSFNGESGHAGNTPMRNRKDSVVAASLFIAEIEKLPSKVSKTAVATVGKLNILPNGVNVIAQEVNLMVDIRDIRKETRDKLIELIYKKAENIAKVRDIKVTWNINTKIMPLPIENKMQEKLAEVVREFEIKPVYIPSGAGHDSMILGKEIPVAMIFARSKDGISHRLEEWTSLDDCTMSVHVLKRFIERIMKDKTKINIKTCGDKSSLR